MVVQPVFCSPGFSFPRDSCSFEDNFLVVITHPLHTPLDPCRICRLAVQNASFIILKGYFTQKNKNSPFRKIKLSNHYDSYESKHNLTLSSSHTVFVLICYYSTENGLQIDFKRGVSMRQLTPLLRVTSPIIVGSSRNSSTVRFTRAGSSIGFRTAAR